MLVLFYSVQAGGGDSQLKSSLASEVAKARQHIKASLESVSNARLV